MSQTKTNEEIKQELIIQLWETGRIDGRYFGKTSKSKKHPIKEYIRNLLYRNFLLQDNEFLEDAFSEFILQLNLIPADKFVAIYNESPNKLLAYSLRIIALKCFAKDSRNPENYKHSLLRSLAYGSVFNSSNYSINSIENVPEDESDDNRRDSLVIYDIEDEADTFLNDYGFTIEEFLTLLSDEDRAFFYQLAGKNTKRGKPTNAFIAQKKALFEKINAIRGGLNNGK